MHPMLGAGEEGADHAVRTCLMAYHGEEGKDSCGPTLRDHYVSAIGAGGLIGKLVGRKFKGNTAHEVQKNFLDFMTTLSVHSPHMFVGPLLNAKTVWGGACNKITAFGRKGFCAFQTKHMLALHVFGENIRNLNPETEEFPVTQWIMTESDGFTRNGLAFSAAKKLYCADDKDTRDQRNAFCIHPFMEGRQNFAPKDGAYWDKNNCLPHAAIGGNENRDTHRWWEPALTNRLVSFFENKDNVGDKMDRPARDRNTCVDIPMQDDVDSGHWQYFIKYTLFYRSDENWETCKEHDQHPR